MQKTQTDVRLARNEGYAEGREDGYKQGKRAGVKQGRKDAAIEIENVYNQGFADGVADSTASGPEMWLEPLDCYDRGGTVLLENTNPPSIYYGWVLCQLP